MSWRKCRQKKNNLPLSEVALVGTVYIAWFLIFIKGKELVYMINWKVRWKSKVFWMAIIPAILLLARQVLSIFGIEFDFTEIQDKILAVVESVFAILVILGIVTDPTTAGVSDSKRALTYTEPYKDKEK